MADDAAPPPSPRIDLAVVRGLIGAARTRLRLQGAIEGAATGAILASASALTAVFLVRTETITEPTGLGLLAASAGVVAAGALLGALGTHDDEHVARRIDRASGLADRLSTAIAFERALRAPGPGDDADADTTALMHAAMRDAAAVAPRASVVKATPFHKPADLNRALAFMAIAAVAAVLGVTMPPRDPELIRAMPDAARRGAEVTIVGARLCGPKAKAEVACNPPQALVYVGDDAGAVAAPITAWTGGGIIITVPTGARLGKTQLVAWARGKRLGAVPFEVIADDDPRNFKSNTVAMDPDDDAYMRDLVADLRATAKKDDVKELDDYAAKIEQLLDQAERGELTKEQLLEAMQRPRPSSSSTRSSTPSRSTRRSPTPARSWRRTSRPRSSPRR
jgi:hypothetical protein